MAITIARASRHVSEWEQSLQRFATRRGWASSLFHACRIDVAAAILRRGEVICRNDVGNLICDVANQGALWNNPAAHNYVRLYFRPRNRFHLKTEGIKSRTDQYRVDPHMSVPIMLVFDFVEIISSDDAYFVNGNFANARRVPLFGDKEFDKLDFDKIYHDSGVSRDEMADIQNARMSEVVIYRRLDLANLKCVICRTLHEEAYLRYLVGNSAANYVIDVEKNSSIFFRRAMYITEIYTINGILHFDFTAPAHGTKPKYDVTVQCEDARMAFQLEPKSWRVPQIRAPNSVSIWKVEIEGCVAYEGTVPSNGVLVR